MTTVYGIKACDTMKKARAWLEANGMAYDFVDYKTAGLSRERLAAWVAQAGWEAILNRRGTTFRKLPEALRQDLDEARAIELMLEQPSMIRRPVIEHEGALLIGFDPEAYGRAFRAPGGG